VQWQLNSLNRRNVTHYHIAVLFRSSDIRFTFFFFRATIRYGSKTGVIGRLPRRSPPMVDMILILFYCKRLLVVVAAMFYNMSLILDAVLVCAYEIIFI